MQKHRIGQGSPSVIYNPLRRRFAARIVADAPLSRDTP
jgi:hypothetical protein